jgi:hypothetical protein
MKIWNLIACAFTASSLFAHHAKAGPEVCEFQPMKDKGKWEKQAERVLPVNKITIGEEWDNTDGKGDKEKSRCSKFLQPKEKMFCMCVGTRPNDSFPKVAACVTNPSSCVVDSIKGYFKGLVLQEPPKPN